MSYNSSSSSTSENISNQISLQNTYEILKNIQKEMQIEIDELTETIKNNPTIPLNENTTPDDISRKQQQFLESLEKLVLEEDPKNYPIPKTKDMRTTAIQSLEDYLPKVLELENAMSTELSKLKNEVSYLENKITGYEKMKEAAINANESEVKITYEEEFALCKRIFSAVKKDLGQTVDTIFPDNNEITKFLLELSKQQLKGGDDVYVEIRPKHLSYTNILETLGIISYHPNNKRMCKMVNFL